MKYQPKIYIYTHYIINKITFNFSYILGRFTHLSYILILGVFLKLSLFISFFKKIYSNPVFILKHHIVSIDMPIGLLFYLNDSKLHC